MNERRLDFELLQRFARQADQSGFAEVVRRHLDLVLVTALRKTGDHGAAQEVAQNVFAALARKAWQFAPDDSLPAWLHKTALFQSNTWLCGELGRRRREKTAAELGTTMNTSEAEPAFASLVPLLDEALLSLREKDRAALLLRFYENQSLRDVGVALGAGEAAATKRVQRALEKLAEFFQRRGFKTATVAALALALEHSATTASAADASALVNAALQTPSPALTGFKSLLARLAILTKPQRVALGGAFGLALLFLCLFLARSLEAANRPSLAIERTGTNVTVRFTGALQRAEQPQGPFRPVTGARSPWAVSAGAGQEFWRAWLPGVSSIAAGGSHTVALRSDGMLWTWGRNVEGQLGNGTNGTNTGITIPQQVGTNTDWGRHRKLERGEGKEAGPENAPSLALRRRDAPVQHQLKDPFPADPRDRVHAAVHTRPAPSRRAGCDESTGSDKRTIRRHKTSFPSPPSTFGYECRNSPSPGRTRSPRSANSLSSIVAIPKARHAPRNPRVDCRIFMVRLAWGSSLSQTFPCLNRSSLVISCFHTLHVVRPNAYYASMIARPFWLERIQAAWKEAPIAWLSGVRRTGKTTLAQDLGDERSLYVNCDLPVVEDMVRDPALFYRNCHQPVVIFDEIHQLRDPSRVLKIGADLFPKLRILATGSSTLAASKKFRDTLTGRKRQIHLTPVLTTELKAFGVPLPKRLLHGGLPPALLAETKKPSFYREWMDSFFARDIQRLFAFRDMNRFNSLFEYLLRQSGGQLEVTRTAAALGITRPTVESHLEALQITHAITLVRPFSGGGQKELVKQPKLYGFDTGFVSFARGWDPLRPDDCGSLWEHLTLEHLQAHLPDTLIRYWRDKAGHEIDFVLPRTRDTVDAVECKWNPASFDASALTVFRSYYPKGRNYLLTPLGGPAYGRRFGQLEVTVCELDAIQG